jgi:valyl-tRNA synthetase
LAGSLLSSISSQWADGLIISSWPESRQVEGWEDGCIADFSLIQESIRSIRNIRSEKDVRPGKRIPALLAAGEKTVIFRHQKDIISALAQIDLEKFEITTQLPPKKENQIAIAFGPVEIYLPLEGLADTDAERERLSKALKSVREWSVSRLSNCLKLIRSTGSCRNCPKEREKLTNYRETADKVKTT